MGSFLSYYLSICFIILIFCFWNLFVVEIAIGANPCQGFKAIGDSVGFDGPWLIIGYAPCVNHGIKGGMGKTQSHEKKAVESGFWNLYRYNPSLKEQGKNPFQQDSGEPKIRFKDFLMSEVRYMTLMQRAT